MEYFGSGGDRIIELSVGFLSGVILVFIIIELFALLSVFDLSDL
jgi:hypothetical protein